MNAPKYKPGDLIRRVDGEVFPTGQPYAIVRKPEKPLPGNWPAVWIEGGQWASEHEVSLVPYETLAKLAMVRNPVPADPPSEWERRYREELVARRRWQKKAAKANDQIDPWKTRALRAEKEIKKAHAAAMLSNIRRQLDNVHSVKIALIKEIIDNDYLVEG